MHEDYESLTVAELRDVTIERGLSMRADDGRMLRKDELVNVLRAHDEAGRSLTIREGQETVGAPNFEPVPVEPVPHAETRAAIVPPAPSTPPEPQYESYLVTEDSSFVKEGAVHRIAKGTVVSSKTHNIKALKAQKVRMVPHAGRYQIQRDAYGNPILPMGREYGPPDTAPRPYVAGSPGGISIVVGPEGQQEVIMPESPSLKPNVAGRIE